jgi:hypothetical protein
MKPEKICETGIMEKIISHICNAIEALKVGDNGSCISAMECAKKLSQEKMSLIKLCQGCGKVSEVMCADCQVMADNSNFL